MATLAVASTSIAKADNAASVVVTKPTGVAVGDLLLIHTYFTGSGATCSGFTAAYNTSPITLLYRIADASDVSASNYTVVCGDSNDSGTATMLRVTGWTGTGNPIYVNTSLMAIVQDSGAGGTLSLSGLNLQRPSPSALLLFLNVFTSGSGTVSSGVFSNYTATSGVANPSWTELEDANLTDGGADKFTVATAYATTTSNTPITAVSSDFTSDALGSDDGFYSVFIVIAEDQNATGTSTLVTTTTTAFTNSGTATATSTSQLVDTDAFANTQSGRGETPTQWSNEAKPTTNWNNESL